MPPTHVNVLGLGHVGLPTASLLATQGYQVTGVDVDPRVLERLSAPGFSPEEPGLATAFRAARESGRLELATAPAPARVHIVAVPTPLDGDGRMDRRPLTSALASLEAVLTVGELVILESTVVPGTSRSLVVPALEASGLTIGSDLLYAHCPERVLPGRILQEYVGVPRILGADDPDSAAAAEEFYSPLVQAPMHRTSVLSAELVKVYENTYRYVNLALANEAARVCARLGLDSQEVLGLANQHPRVDFLRPGPGVGGHCVPVDPLFLLEAAGDDLLLVQAARATNTQQPTRVAEQALALLEARPRPRVPVLGAAYKPDVGDIRMSPTQGVVERLRKEGVEVRLHDPHVEQFDPTPEPLMAAVEGSDCLLVLVAHSGFRNLSPDSLFPLMRRRLVLDACQGLTASAWTRAGFEYQGLAPR